MAWEGGGHLHDGVWKIVFSALRDLNESDFSTNYIVEGLIILNLVSSGSMLVKIKIATYLVVGNYFLHMATIFFTPLAEAASSIMAYNMELILGVLLMLTVPAVFILSLVKLIITKRKRWIICLIISGLLGLFFISAIIHSALETYKTVADAAAENMDHSMKNAQVVQTADGLLKFNLPKAWSTLDELPEEASLRYGSLRGELYIVVLSEPKTDFEDGYSLELYGEGCLQNIIDVSKQYKQKEWITSEVSGCKIMKIQVDAVVDGIKVKYFNGYLETDTHYHQVLLWTLPSMWEKSKPVFESVLSSIEPLK